jgi:hypothetical protein
MKETEMVIAALENPDYDWRTIEGIVNDTKLSPERVLHIIKTLESELIRSSIPDEKGRPLYTTRKHYSETHSVYNRFINVVGNRINK